jgi:hypothetical protein
LLEASLAAGVSVAEFWLMTPRETRAALAAWGRRQRAETRRLQMLAWATAALQRTQRLPELRRWLGDDGAEAPRRRGGPGTRDGERAADERRRRDEVIRARMGVDAIPVRRRVGGRHGG